MCVLVREAPRKLPGRIDSMGRVMRRNATTAGSILGLVRVAFQSGQRNIAPDGNNPSSSGTGNAGCCPSSSGRGIAILSLSLAPTSALFFDHVLQELHQARPRISFQIFFELYASRQSQLSGPVQEILSAQICRNQG